MNFVGFVKFSVLINREEINSFRATNGLIMKFSNIREHIDLFGKFVTMFEKKFNVMYFYRILRDNPHLSNTVCIIFYTNLYQFRNRRKVSQFHIYLFFYVCSSISAKRFDQPQSFFLHLIGHISWLVQLK